MQTPKIRYSRRTCFVYNQQAELIGKIQFQRDANFLVWKIKYLSDQLPIHSYDRPCDVKDKLEKNQFTWQWGPIKHHGGYVHF